MSVPKAQPTMGRVADEACHALLPCHRYADFWVYDGEERVTYCRAHALEVHYDLSHRYADAHPELFGDAP